MVPQNDIETLMRDLARSSVELRRALFKNDSRAATTPEGTEGSTVRVHACTLCYRMAAGDEAQIRHEAGCPVKRLMDAQERLKTCWPELFKAAPKSESAPEAPMVKIPKRLVVDL